MESGKHLNRVFDKYEEELDTSMVSLRFMKIVDQYLIDNNMEQKELAEKMNISSSRLSQLLSGSKNVNMKFIYTFEKVTGAKIFWNVSYEDKPKSRMVQMNPKQSILLNRLMIFMSLNLLCWIPLGIMVIRN